MTQFYTNVAVDGNKILYRGLNDGKRVQKILPYKPRLYLKAPPDRNTLWHTLRGEPLEEKIFNNIYEARCFVKRYENVEGFEIYGNQKYLYAFIADMFPGHIDVDTSLVKIACIDIEVNTSNGNPDLKAANEFINAITVSFGDNVYAFGLKDFDSSKYPNVKYLHCEDETQLLAEFLEIWKSNYPDVITGWNVKLFDIPYLLNRLILTLGYEEASKFSPWSMIESRKTKNDFGNEEQTYTVTGISIIDYIDLYKKYSPTPNQENYRLETIGSVELDEHKVDYEALGYKNLHDLYTRNHQLFIEYNIQDVNLVNRIDDKLGLIELAITLATRNHVNYEDVFFQVRMWDSIVHNKLTSRNIALPPHKIHHKDFLEGAYVKQPLPGRYRWLVSFDLNSLYPHLIMMYNLSPETILDSSEYDKELSDFKKMNQIDVKGLLDKEFDLNFLKNRNLAMTPNGQFFRTDVKGFMSELMEEMFEARKAYKDKMMEAKRQFKNEQDPEKQKQLKKQISSFNALQSAYKVTLNSCYGALGSPWFRLFDIRIAEAITLSGQLSIRWIQNDMNAYFNKILRVENEDFVVASDTDSLYLSMDKMVNTFLPNSTLHKTVDFMNKVCEEKLKPFISTSYQNLADYINAYDQKMVMKRENIMDQAIFIGKKNYIVSVCIDEAGVNNCDKPDVKITGLVVVKSSTSKLVKKPMREIIDLMLRGTEDQVIDVIEKFKTEFKKQNVSEISSPRGVNDIAKFSDHNGMYVKGAPYHVKGALVYNKFIKTHGLEKQYPLIRERDKMRFVYLKSPNPFQCNVMGFIDKIPPEMNLDRYIDVDMQFDTSFKNPVEGWLKAIGWRVEKSDSVESFFD